MSWHEKPSTMSWHSTYNLWDYVLDQMLYLDQMKNQWDNTINNVVSNGVTWAQSAGNDGQKKWIGAFTDSDNNRFLNFSPTENWNEIDVLTVSSGDYLYILMTWDLDHAGSTYDDYDLFIADNDGNTACSSTKSQSIFPFGMEACAFQVNPDRTYAAYVYRYQGNFQDIGLLLGHDKFPNFKYPTPSGTVILGPPAHNPNVITVGAVPYYLPNIIEPYSSQGPNADGIIKPDLVAPDCVSTVSWSGLFRGTSAAAPHVAGASALVKQAYPYWSPSQIKSYFEANALDLGASGKDNVFGSGLVQLPSDLRVTARISPIWLMLLLDD